MTGWTLWKFPFFDASHYELAERVAAWTTDEFHEEPRPEQLAGISRDMALSLGKAGLLDCVLPKRDAKGHWTIDVRSICLVREGIGYRSGLADSVVAMQGLGTAAIWMHGTPEQQEKYLEPARRGEKIAGLALTEPTSGSDVANITTSAVRDGDHYVINGEKAFITNGNFADHFIVYARTGEAPGARGLTGFIVDAGTPGLIQGEPMDMMAPHPLAPLTFRDCRVPASNVIGTPGNGFKVAMSTFDIFRPTVGAATIGMAGRALHAVLERVHERNLFGGPMADLAGVQSRIADMTIDLEMGALAVYRAAWARDTMGGRCTKEASLAKFVGTENAGRIVDNAVQIFGGLGVTRGSIVEHLYREVRASRIYEGASEVQKLVIARQVLADYKAARQ
jgi:acyl-CoA dehydrogenase